MSAELDDLAALDADEVRAVSHDRLAGRRHLGWAHRHGSGVGSGELALAGDRVIVDHAVGPADPHVRKGGGGLARTMPPSRADSRLSRASRLDNALAVAAFD